MDCFQYIIKRAPSKLDAGLQRMERYRGEDDVRGRRSSCNAVAGIHRTKIVLHPHVHLRAPRTPRRQES